MSPIIKLSHLRMNSPPPKRELCDHCHRCDCYIHPTRAEVHANQHTSPHLLTPQTKPNNLAKLALTKPLNLEDTTEDSDLAVRSILPEDYPKPNDERREAHAPTSHVHPTRTDFRIASGAPAHDVLDLQSNVAGTDLARDALSQLQIERKVDLKPVRTVLHNKEIHKYQNSSFQARETVYAGKQDRKIMSLPLPSAVLGAALPPTDPEQMYEVKEDPGQTTFLGSSRKSTVTVPLSFSKPRNGVYSPVDTKCNLQESRRQPVGYAYEQNPRDRVSKSRREDEESEFNNSRRNDKVNSISGHREYPTHPNECPDCHGFWCRTCNATIPARYRPFWDEDEKPEVIAYYKKQQEEAVRRNCHNCSEKHKE